MAPHYLTTIFRSASIACILLLSVAITAPAQNIWQPVNNGLTGSWITTFGQQADGSILASSGDQLFLLDGKGHWSRLHSGIVFTSLGLTSKGTLIATDEEVLYRSTNGGTTWIAVYTLPIPASGIYGFLTGNKDTITFSSDAITVRSTDDGVTWSATGSEYDIERFTHWTAPNGTQFKIVTTAEYNDGNDGIWRSVDNGQTWQLVRNFVARNGVAPFMITSDGTLWLGVGRHVLRSGNNGSEWEDVVAGLDNAPVVKLVAGEHSAVYAIIPSGTVDYPGNGVPYRDFNGLFRTTSNGNLWELITDTLDYYPVMETSAGVLLATQLHVAPSDGAFNYRLHTSTDQGTTWEQVDDTLGLYGGIKANDKGTVVAGLTTGILVSSDGGVSWTKHSTDFLTSSIAVTPNNAILVNAFQSRDTGFYADFLRSTDLGVTWQSVGVDGGSIETAADSSLLMIGADGLKRSNDDGVTWNTILQGQVSQLIITDAGTVFVQQSSHMMRSTDYGATWNNSPLIASDIVSYGDHLYAISTDGEVYHSTNAGSSWTRIHDGLPEHEATALAVNSDGALFVGTARNGVYRLDNIASVPNFLQETESSLLVIAGQQPVTSTMTVQITHPTETYTLLTLHDMLGRQVATLANAPLSAGMHSMTFDASMCPSGMYLLVLQANGTTTTRKVVIR